MIRFPTPLSIYDKAQFFIDDLREINTKKIIELTSTSPPQPAVFSITDDECDDPCYHYNKALVAFREANFDNNVTVFDDYQQFLAYRCTNASIQRLIKAAIVYWTEQQNNLTISIPSQQQPKKKWEVIFPNISYFWNKWTQNW